MHFSEVVWHSVVECTDRPGLWWTAPPSLKPRLLLSLKLRVKPQHASITVQQLVTWLVPPFHQWVLLRFNTLWCDTAVFEVALVYTTAQWSVYSRSLVVRGFQGQYKVYCRSSAFREDQTLKWKYNSVVWCVWPGLLTQRGHAGHTGRGLWPVV